MPAKVMILAQFEVGYYIRGTLKRLTDVADWLKAWWICFDHGYYIRGTLKRLTDVADWPKAWWIYFDHGYYIHGTLKWLTGALAWLKAWWLCVGVKQLTDQKSMPPLPRRRGNAHKSHDFGSVWPRILYPWDFEEADRCFGLAQGLVDLPECETSHRLEIHAPVASAETKCPQKSCFWLSLSTDIISVEL
ncbi:hypothetical protein C8R44DRAFT_736999 [Mycena epipterygia]|nr:hypothetical protein C8R44DRAFT_736999 [Mycena epipterygia]